MENQFGQQKFQLTYKSLFTYTECQFHERNEKINENIDDCQTNPGH